MILRRSLSGKQWLSRSADLPSATDAQDLVEFLRRERNIPDHEEPVSYETIAWNQPQMAQSVDRIFRAIERRETIGIFGDYDCDGITSTAQLVRFFSAQGVSPLVRLPHRVHDGYGLSLSTIDAFARAHVDLLLTVDTGIASAREIEAAKARGIDVIIVDHHHVTEIPMAAYAVLHPSLDPSFAGPHPSAAGMVFLLLTALHTRAPWSDRCIDLVLATLGTIADIVPLRGLNRGLVLEGLSSIPLLPPCSLRHVLERACPQGSITSSDIAFRVAPRINAAGRMDSAMLALRALLEGGSSIDALDACNGERQLLMQDLFQSSLSAFANSPTLPPLLSSASQAYTHGTIGLLAGKLTESYGRPSMVATFRDGKGSASLRSTHAYNVMDGLLHCKDLLLTYGGHAQAGGCTFDADRWPVLEAKLLAHVAAYTDPALLVATLPCDASIETDMVTLDFCKTIHSLAPFGMSNEEPQFLIADVACTDLRRVGSSGQHLQLTCNGIKAIGFQLGQFFDQLPQRIDLLCRVGTNTWHEKTVPQLFLADIALAQ